MNDYLGEFLGTMILTLMGCGVVAGVLLKKSKAENAGWLVITTGWALAVLAGLSTSLAIGGPGYINPVGPIADVLTKSLAVEKALGFILAEMAGGFTGAVLVWLHYHPHWAETPDAGAKLAVFSTAPAIRNSPWNLLSEAIGTFVLVFVGTMIAKAAGGMAGAPLGGALVWGIGLSLGATTGYAINPARDLGPRIAHAVLPIAGKGGSDWSYAWIPVVGPIIGGSIGALLAKAVLSS